MKIFMITHKPFIPPADELYVPIQVGCSLQKEAYGYMRDDTGIHISNLNPFFCELTGQYYIWKNHPKMDYVGFMHYRRVLLGDQGGMLTHEECKTLLTKYDVITTKRVTLTTSYYEAFGGRHHQKDLDTLENVLRDYFFDYYKTYKKLVRDNKPYFGNMYIMSWERFCNYCDFLFPVLFEVMKRTDMAGYDGYQKRLYGFLSEFLLGVYLERNHLKVKNCKVGMIGAKTETEYLLENMKVLFEQGAFIKAKQIFMEAYQKRPDILMEASDVNGELGLSMQAISVYEWEKETGIPSILEKRTDKSTRWEEAIFLYKELNQITRRINKLGQNDMSYEKIMTKEEFSQLEKWRISKVEYDISMQITANKTG